MEITLEEFRAYQAVQAGGRTNMLDTLAVAELALAESDVYMTKTQVRYIISNYKELLEKYGRAE